MTMQRNEKGQLLKGSGGRQPGSRNRLQGEFIEALADDFSQHGVGAIRIMRVEKPAEYVKVVASVLPKEWLLAETSPLAELSDADLDKVISFARANRKGAA